VRTSAVSVLMVRVRSPSICSRATTSTRIATRARSLDSSRGVRRLVKCSPSTARAICVAASSSFLPMPRRSPAGIRAASTTDSPARCNRSVTIAPKDPVPSTTMSVARSLTCCCSQLCARSPAGLVGNSACAMSAPVAAATSAKMWVAAWVSTPMTYSYCTDTVCSETMRLITATPWSGTSCSASARDSHREAGL